MILIVDDESENRSSLMEVLKRDGWICYQAEGAEEALALLRSKRDLRLLITDLKMPGMNGLELLESARILRPDVQRLLVTAFGTIEDTVSAMKAGAFDVLPKPLRARKVREKVREMMERGMPAVAELGENGAENELSAPFSQVIRSVQKAATSQAHVLFLGPSGSGKSYLARILHDCSPRAEGPFVPLNCATIPGELLESELFGYEKGAFTGASQSRQGKIAAADGGTLLLDEIGDLSPALQAKLLQFIQEKKYFRLGSNRELNADVRIVAATHRNLEELVEKNLFRQDLLYRLRVVEIFVPALSERKKDLFWLVPSLLEGLCKKNGKQPVSFTSQAFSALWNYSWPGNVRELENVLESALVMADASDIQEGFLGLQNLPDRVRGAEAGLPSQVLPDLATLERQALDQALVLTAGNRRLAAKLLGISERTLYRILDREPKNTNANPHPV